MIRHPAECHCGWCLKERIEVLEAQVKSLQMAAPRGIETKKETLSERQAPMDQETPNGGDAK